jgi:ABC-type transport system involved in multi-copper enzyme maturation permease subunit
MRLFAAEVLKLRRRWATYVLEAILLGLMVLVFFLVGITPRGTSGFGGASPFTFPGVYGVINQFVFGLGSLLAVAFAGAVGGADFTWGVFRVIVARGESRTRYLLTKFAAIVLFVFLGVVVAFVVGILLTYVVAAMQGISAGSPFAGSAPNDLLRSFAFGMPVIIERVAIGFAVAVVLRSQIAGIVAGIVLQIGEGLIQVIILATTFASQAAQTGTLAPIGPEWFQFLPFAIGDAVLAEAPGVGGGGGDGPGPGLLLRDVPLDTALIVTAIYLVAALLISVIRVERSEITT